MNDKTMVLETVGCIKQPAILIKVDSYMDMNKRNFA